MYSELRTGLLALLAATAASAQDAIILTSGQTLKGHVLRYDNSRFSIFVSNEVREVYADDVHSIFFGVEDSLVPTQVPVERTTATSAPPKVVETTVSAPPARPAATGAPLTTSTKQKPPPARTDYGPSEGNFSVSEMIARSPQVDGKVVKQIGRASCRERV